MVTVRKTSPITGNTNEMAFDMSPAEYEKALTEWKNGTLIQDAFANLNATEREFLMTGIYGEAWDNMFDDRPRKTPGYRFIDRCRRVP